MYGGLELALPVELRVQAILRQSELAGAGVSGGRLSPPV